MQILTGCGLGGLLLSSDFISSTLLSTFSPNTQLASEPSSGGQGRRSHGLVMITSYCASLVPNPPSCGLQFVDSQMWLACGRHPSSYPNQMLLQQPWAGPAIMHRPQMPIASKTAGMYPPGHNLAGKGCPGRPALVSATRYLLATVGM
jgi:hypothetical protein